MDKAIMIEVENLRREGVTSLRKRYRELFQEEARSRHREHLFRKIVWRLQALSEGQLSDRARARAREIANDADLRVVAPKSFFSVGGEPVAIIPRDQSKKINDPRLPMVGTILRRSWKGRTILVEVLANGFRYENRQYPSLSNIAFEIGRAGWRGDSSVSSRRKTQEPGGKERSERDAVDL